MMPGLPGQEIAIAVSDDGLGYGVRILLGGPAAGDFVLPAGMAAQGRRRWDGAQHAAGSAGHVLCGLAGTITAPMAMNRIMKLNRCPDSGLASCARSGGSSTSGSSWATGVPPG
jgi:hypothetical protein